MSKRLVIIKGTARWNQLFSSTSSLKQYLTMAFSNQGFDVVSIDIESQSAFNKYINLTLHFNVFYQYGNQDALQSTKQLLQNFTYNSVLGNGDNERVIDNVSLQVIYDAGLPNTVVSQSKINSKSAHPKVIDVGTIAAVNIDTSDNSSDFFDNVSQTIGISKQNIFIGTIVIAIILSRR